MPKTETSDVVPAATLTVTLPSYAALSGNHAAVIHTPVDAGASSPLLSDPLGASGHVAPAMPDVRTAAAVPVSSADQI